MINESALFELRVLGYFDKRSWCAHNFDAHASKIDDSIPSPPSPKFFF